MEMKEYRPLEEKLTFSEFDRKREECCLDQGAIKKLIPSTLEGCVVRVSDIIAYIGKDRQDAEKLKLFEEKPSYSQKKIGTTNAEIINNMVVMIYLQTEFK
jgi:dGTPase